MRGLPRWLGSSPPEFLCCSEVPAQSRVLVSTPPALCHSRLPERRADLLSEPISLARPQHPCKPPSMQPSLQTAPIIAFACSPPAVSFFPPRFNSTSQSRALFL